jgi:large subunit ribosomal protein L20
MTRVKRGVAASKRRNNILKDAKGFRHARSTKVAAAKDALRHAGAYAFAHRRDKKNDFRRLWTVKLNAALRELGTTYSVFIDTMAKKGIALNRKVLSEIASESKESFTRIVSQIK